MGTSHPWLSGTLGQQHRCLGTDFPEPCHPAGVTPLREQARGRPVWSSRGGPGTSRLTLVVQGTPTSFSSSWCLGLLTLGLHPRACRGGLARPSPGARCGGSRASAWPPQGQLLAGGAGITPCSGLPTPERRVLGLPAPGAVGVRWAEGEPPLPPALGSQGRPHPGRHHISFRLAEALRFKNHQGFLLLIEDVHYSQRPLIMRKKELPFVCIWDLECHTM